ncbi:hypothetical protein DOY81_011511 [Sarcophaga bullata]|nr:hypothetical protein DOY81_011511 [Sarcophaga bullata]
MPPKAITAKLTKRSSHRLSKQKLGTKVHSAHKMGAKAAILYKKKSADLEELSDKSLSNASVSSNDPLQSTLFAKLSKEEEIEQAIAAIDSSGSTSLHSVSVEGHEEEDYTHSGADLQLDTPKEVKPQPTVTRIKRRIYYEDEGKFVNPLTGELSISDISEIPSIEVVAPVKIQAPQPSEAERASLESKDSVFSDTSAVAVKKPILDILEDIGLEEDTQGLDEDQEAYLQFLELETKEKEKEQLTAEQFKIQAEELMKEQQKQLNFEQTIDFLNILIDQVVDKAEYIDENVILRKNLDKRKIITELSHIMDELSKEKSLMVFLNRQCYYHYRRKSGHKHSSDDYSRERKEKLYENLIIFSQMLQKETETRVKCKERIRKCKEQYEIAKQQTNEEIKKFEKLITSTFHLDKHHNLKDTINSELTKLSEFRETVSHVRGRLLIDQHNFTELSMRMEKLEDLGHGLNLRDYDNLATETKALTKKIEERDTMLDKLKVKCNSHIHTMAHLKEKQRWMRHIVSVQEDVLAELLEDKMDVRRYINKLRLKRMKLKQEIREK